MIITQHFMSRSPRHAARYAALLAMIFIGVAGHAVAAVTYVGSAQSNGSTITFVGSNSATSTGNSLTIAFPAGAAENDVVVAQVAVRGDNDALPTPSGWTKIGFDENVGNGGNRLRHAAYYRVLSSADITAGDATWSFNGNCTSTGGLSVFRNVDTTNPLHDANANSSTTNTDSITAPGFTTTVDGAMLVALYAINNNLGFTPPTGYTERYEQPNGTSVEVMAADFLQTSAGATGNAVADLSANHNRRSGHLIALTPATNTLTIDVPAGTAAGDVMIASIAVRPSTIDITAPVGWSLIRTLTQGSGASNRLATYYRVAGASEPASYTWIFSGTNTGRVGGIASFRGVDATAPIDAELGATTASSTSHAAPDITTTVDDGMLVTSHEFASAMPWSAPSGMTEVVDIASETTPNAAGIALAMNYESRATAGATGTRTATVTGNADTGATQSVALRPAPLTCYTDDFNRADGSPGSDWVVSNSSGSFGNPVIVNNRLRLTDASGNVATMATLQRLFPGAGNRIEVEFEHFADGGSGADGIALAFSDSSITPAPGGYGGSLGYAQRTGVDGFAGGWLGIGIDEFGNFSNPTEGRSGGPGFFPDSVTIRGSGSGTSGYNYHANTGTLSPEVDNNGSASPAHRYRIIVDHSNGINAWVSVERDTGSGYQVLIAPYDAKAQSGQANVPGSWMMSWTGSTGGSTNVHEIDGLRICATSQTSAVAINNFLITVAAAASTCAPQSVTITARDASNNTLTSYAGTINLTTSSGRGDWALSAGGGTFANGTANDGAASYTFVAGDNGAVTLSLTNHHADDLTIGVVDSGVPSTASTSGTVNFRDNAFVITNDPIQIAGRGQSMSVAMWRRDPSTGNCAIATNYTGAKDLDAWLTRDVSDPGGVAPTINGVSLPNAAPVSDPVANNLSGGSALTFANGMANFTLATADVGRYTLSLRDDTRAYANAVDLGGASSGITTRPWLHAAAAGNPAVSAAGGAVFTSAGTNFTATVRGVLWQAADDANDDGVPDAGADLTNNAVTPSYAWATALSAAAPYTPAAGTLGTLANGSLAQGDFSGGSATVTALQYSDVGSFTMQAQATNYLNSGIDVTNTSGVVGRFTPAYFNVAADPACIAGAFTYSGQPFALVTVTPYSAAGGVINNYRTGFGFAKDVTISNAGVASNFNGTNTVAESAFTGANGSSTGVTYTFLAKETVPATLTLRAVDTDNVSSAGHTEASMQVRSGRLLIQSAYGSELVALRMPMRAQYYDNAVPGWVTNNADTCTPVPATDLQLSNGSGTVNGPGPIAIGSGTTSANVSNSPLSSGDAGLSFSAPGAGGDGFANVTIRPGVLPDYLKFDWDNDGAHDDDPSGRATFGIYRGSPRNIYLRERY